MQNEFTEIKYSSSSHSLILLQVTSYMQVTIFDLNCVSLYQTIDHHTTRRTRLSVQAILKSGMIEEKGRGETPKIF